MFNKLLIAMIGVFIIGACLFSQNTHGNNLILDESNSESNYFNEWDLIFNNSLKPTILSSNRNIEPRASARITPATGDVIANDVFANINDTSASWGGAIQMEGVNNINITNVVFNNNTTGNFGGAIGMNNAYDIYLNDVKFNGNSADYGGAVAIYKGSNTYLNNADFTDNVGAHGGAMYVRETSNVNLTDVTFTDNKATVNHGGAMYIYDVTNINLTDVTFTDNEAANFGGGMYLFRTKNASLNNSTFSNNTAKYGGAIFLDNSTNINMNGVTFTGNTAGAYGGAIFIENSTNINMNGVTFTGNTADVHGGAILATDVSNFSLNNSTFTGNTAGNRGGAIIMQRVSNFSLNNSTFTENTADYRGGAILAYKVNDFYLNNLTFTDNTAVDRGGALFMNTAININLTDVTFTGNTSGLHGGAIHMMNAANVSLNNVSFTGNTAGGNGGAISIHDATDINFNVTSGNTSTFSNNNDSSGANSIYFDGAAATDTIFNVNTASGGTLDMFDGMKSSVTLGSLAINKTGSGDWNIYGNSIFNSADTKINIAAGKFNMGDGAQIKFNGANSSFVVEEGVVFDVVIKDGIPVLVGNGTDTIVDIKTQEQITIAAGSYVEAGGTETFTIMENMKDINIANPNLAYDDSHILLYANNAKLIAHDTITRAGPTYHSATADIGRYYAADVMQNLDGGLASTIDQYMGDNQLLENILTSGNATAAESHLTTLSHVAKASGSLHAYDVIGSAINQQILYGIKSRQGNIEQRLTKSKIPINVGITPLFMFSETFDEENNMKLGSELMSFGGLIYFGMELPTTIVTSEIGVVGGGGYTETKSIGDYSDVENDSIYYTGGLYYNLGYDDFRTTISAFYLGMKNESIKDFGKSYKTDFLTHGVNVGLDFAYDFNFIKELFFSPFVTFNYSFYYHPKLDTKFDDDVVFETSEGSKHNFHIPVGFALSYDFYVEDIHIITPSVRFNGNIPVYDSGLKTSWLLDDITTGQKINNTITQNHDTGIFDANFNLSYKINSLMVYADYTFEYYENDDMSHFVGLGVKVAL